MFEGAIGLENEYLTESFVKLRIWRRVLTFYR